MNTEPMDPGDARTVELDYYDGPGVVDTLLDALIHAGFDPDALDIDDLAPPDEFHALGRAATLALAELAGRFAAHAAISTPRSALLVPPDANLNRTAPRSS